MPPRANNSQPPPPAMAEPMFTKEQQAQLFTLRLAHDQALLTAARDANEHSAQLRALEIQEINERRAWTQGPQSPKQANEATVGEIPPAALAAFKPFSVEGNSVLLNVHHRPIAVFASYDSLCL